MNGHASFFFRAPEDEKEIFVNLTLDRSRQRKRLSGRKSILRLQDGTRCDTLAAYNPMGLGGSSIKKESYP